METRNIPTSQEIAIEINGRALGAAQSYRVQSSRESRYVEAFGSREPVGTVGGRVKHRIELSRVYLCWEDEVDFYSLSDFNLSIAKPDGRELFLDCQWGEILQSATVNEVVLEKVSIVAGRRLRL